MRLMLLILLSLMLISCSSQFAYRHLDWFILWYSDDYLDLNRQQENKLEDELTQLINWHAQSELPKYRVQLQAISNDLNTLPASDALISRHISDIRQHWQYFRQHISKQIPPLVQQLSASQVEYLFDQLAQDNQDKLDDYQSLTPDQIQERKLERTEEIFIDWLGSINTLQAELLYKFISHQKDLTLDRLAYLSAYQARLKSAMLPPINEPALEALLLNSDAFKSQDYLNKQADNRQNMSNFIKEITNSLQPDQARHLQKKLKTYIDTIDDILESDQ